LSLAPGADGLGERNFTHGIKLDAPSNLTAKKHSRSGRLARDLNSAGPAGLRSVM